jgi:NAD kinase
MIERILIASKKTAKEYFQELYGKTYEAFLKRFDLEKREVEAAHDAHYKRIHALIDAFKDRGFTVEVRLKRQYQPKDFDWAQLIISFGGDGEMLDVARYIMNSQLVLGICSDVRSRGQLLTRSELTFDYIIEHIQNNDYTVENWTRIKGVIFDGSREIADTALNEIYVGDYFSVGTARYTIYMNGQEERQKSSGVILSTGTGSTGWFANVLQETDPCSNGVDLKCAGYPPPYSRSARELRYIVRDPIDRKQYRFLGGTISTGIAFSIKSTMNQDGIVSFDCSKKSYENPRAYDFNRGSILTVSIAPNLLKVISFDSKK